jgi:hypothetical protein
MPPLQVSASSSASAKGGDGAFGGSSSALSQGDWNVSQGSGDAGSSNTTWLYVLAAAGAAWFLAKKKAA